MREPGGPNSTSLRAVRPAEGVAGRILGVVALGLDDHAGGRPWTTRSRSGRARPVDRAVEEVRAQRLAAAGSRARRPTSCGGH